MIETYIRYVLPFFFAPYGWCGVCGGSFFCSRQGKKQPVGKECGQDEKRKKKVLPGIEPGFRDSESPVITVTLQDPSVSYAPDITLSKKSVLTIHLGKFRGIYDRDANP